MRHSNQLVKYDIDNNKFTDYGEDYLSDTMGNWNGEHGSGGYYSQLNSTMLYTIASSGYYIHAYNLKELSFQQLNTTIPITAYDYAACLASSETPSPRLYVTGADDGVYGMDDLQVLDLDQSQWLTNMTSMQYNRSDHGCIVVDERLFVVGGDDVTAIETIKVVDIESASWETFGTLSSDVFSFGQLVVFEEIIYIIGGFDYGTGAHASSIYYDTVYTIDTITNEIALDSNTIPFGASSIATICVGTPIYGFGGADGTKYKSGTVVLDDGTKLNLTLQNGTNMWMSYEMLSTKDTANIVTSDL